MTPNRGCEISAGLANQEEFAGGLSFAAELRASALDFTRASLGRIDTLLDGVRESKKPVYGAFLDAHANQNFLYLLCFYVGYDDFPGAEASESTGSITPRCSSVSLTTEDVSQLFSRPP